MLGYEREKRNKAAGIVTHSLVAISSSSLAILQVELFQNSIEQQRLIAQIITGIGFLGGGAILKTKDTITGLTTASTLWTSGILGLIFGMGYFELGIITSTFVLIYIYGVKKYIRYHYKKKKLRILKPKDEHKNKKN